MNLGGEDVDVRLAQKRWLLNLAHSLKMVRNSVLEYKIFYLKM
jgi:hypothetical protein